MTRNDAIGAGLTGAVGYEGYAYLMGKPTFTAMCARRPWLAYAVAGIWLGHVMWQIRELAREIEECGEWH